MQGEIKKKKRLRRNEDSFQLNRMGVMDRERCCQSNLLANQIRFRMFNSVGFKSSIQFVGKVVSSIRPFGFCPKLSIQFADQQEEMAIDLSTG